MAANQHLRRAIIDENHVCPGVGGMREMHKAAAGHSIFVAVKSTTMRWAPFLKSSERPCGAAHNLAYLLREMRRGFGRHPTRMIPAHKRLRTIVENFCPCPFSSSATAIHPRLERSNLAGRPAVRRHYRARVSRGQPCINLIRFRFDVVVTVKINSAGHALDVSAPGTAVGCRF